VRCSVKAEAFARHLDARRTGAGRWLARCPAHEDRSPSLSIREGRKGRTLICCHAGCAVTGILKAAGLGLRDLFEGPQQSPQQVRAANSERDRIEALREARRVNERVDIDFMGQLERRLDTVVRELGRKLALMPDDDSGVDALTAKFHAAITAYQLADRSIIGDPDDHL
jgi:hypothetical protein